VVIIGMVTTSLITTGMITTGTDNWRKPILFVFYYQC